MIANSNSNSEGCALIGWCDASLSLNWKVLNLLLIRKFVPGNKGAKRKIVNHQIFEKAKNLFKKVISINKNIPEVYNNLGSILLNEKNFKEAIKYFNQAITLNPKLSVAYLNLGIIYQKINEFKMAEKNYLQSILLNKDNLTALYNLGNLYSDNNDLVNAEKYFRRSIDLKPDMEQAYRNLFFIFDRSLNQPKLLKELYNTKHVTLWFFLIKASTKWEPMNPSEPVTRFFFFI